MHVQQFEIFYSYQNEKSLKSILVNMKNQHSSDINNDAYLKLKITMLKTVSRKDSETLIRSTRSWQISYCWSLNYNQHKQKRIYDNANEYSAPHLFIYIQIPTLIKDKKRLIALSQHIHYSNTPLDAFYFFTNVFTNHANL